MGVRARGASVSTSGARRSGWRALLPALRPEHRSSLGNIGAALRCVCRASACTVDRFRTWNRDYKGKARIQDISGCSRSAIRAVTRMRRRGYVWRKIDIDPPRRGERILNLYRQGAQ